MRTFGLTLITLLLGGAALSAQQPSNGAAAAAAVNASLDAVLGRWEQSMKSVTNLTAQLNRTTLEKAFQTTEVFEGTAKYMKPNMAILFMTKRGKPEVYEKYMCSGNYLYEFAPRDKVIRVHEMPRPKQGNVADDNLLSFLFGMKAADAKARYELTLLPSPANDRWYSYILIKPRSAADKNDFARARLVLNSTTFLPRQLWFEQPNGNEITWDFLKIDTKTELKRAEFMPPQLPRDWKMEQVRKDTPPRVIRPNR
jgi:TIGR03009 family protein